MDQVTTFLGLSLCIADMPPGAKDNNNTDLVSFEIGVALCHLDGRPPDSDCIAAECVHVHATRSLRRSYKHKLIENLFQKSD